MFNFCVETGGLNVVNEKIKINYDSFNQCLEKLARILSTIEAEGNYRSTIDLFKKYNNKSDFVNHLTRDIKEIPTEIWPNYVV
jgi:hypothetical protein